MASRLYSDASILEGMIGLIRWGPHGKITTADYNFENEKGEICATRWCTGAIKSLRMSWGSLVQHLMLFQEYGAFQWLGPVAWVLFFLPCCKWSQACVFEQPVSHLKLVENIHKVSNLLWMSCRGRWRTVWSPCWTSTLKGKLWTRLEGKLQTSEQCTSNRVQLLKMTLLGLNWLQCST